MTSLFDLFDLIWSQTMVAYFQNWPSYGGDWGLSWLLFFVIIPFFGIAFSGLSLSIWSNKHHTKYPVDKDAEPEKELPKAPEGLFVFSIKENSSFVKMYLKEFKIYPRSLCDYAPYCAGLTAIIGFSGLFVLGVLVLSSNILFYWLWVGLWKALSATLWVVVIIFTEFMPWLATSLFVGATGAVSYTASSSATTKIAIFIAAFGLTILFWRSQACRATRLWAYSKAKKMCVPLRIVPTKKPN